MTTHLVTASRDAERPATLSPALVNGLLREEMGFDGVVVTDDLEMGALAGHGVEALVEGACAAGHDVLMFCHDAEAQRRAHACLVGGARRGASWFGDAQAVARRLMALRAPPAAGPVAAEDGWRIAEAIAGRAVTVLSDEARLVPLPADLPRLLVVPAGRTGTQVEDPFRAEDPALLATLLDPRAAVEEWPLAPDDADVDRVLARAAAFPRVLIGTAGLRFHERHAQAVERLLAAHPGCVVIPLRHPWDGSVAAKHHAAAVTAYGFRPVHLQALAAVLEGRVQPYGRAPFNG
jgi:beta-N-acetylhexosaminidase